MADFAKRFQITDELFRRNAPIADFVINEDVSFIGGAGLHTEPGVIFCAGFRAVVRPVV
ncbi:Uncharacterised protein [Ewingella americana]|uniref:Uncharacterized protein n=1 Tax=Ewingella americana TaxID=41202 RepID=A0A377TD67_9GAMM|nr:Uncharacterised protein [Ewingella americana]